MDPHALVLPLLGGALLGASLMVVLFLTGRSEGIGGMLAGLLTGSSDERWSRAGYLGGMILAGGLLATGWPAAFADDSGRPLALSMLGALLIGFGSRMANGCTSGHCILGASRFSKRSWSAGLIFGLVASIVVALYPPRPATDGQVADRTGSNNGSAP
jgi:uncharacterized membrane protein YedE/YeeE